MNPDSEKLFALVYSSDAVGFVGDQQLTAILEQARTKNALLDITGILLYRRGRFIQYLEGPEDRVRKLYNEICADSRHEHLRLLFETPVDTRQFSDWTMGYEQLREAQDVTPAGFRSTFDDLENTEQPEQVLRAVSELTFWYHARVLRARKETR